MASFADQVGTIWQVKLEFGELECLADEMDCDLLDLEKDGLSKIEMNERKFVDVLQYLLKEQFAASQIDTKMWRRGMTTEVLAEAKRAFREAFDFFCQKVSPVKAEILRQIRGNTETVAKMGIEDALSRRQGQSPKVVNRISESLSTGLPESSESIPGNTR